MSDDHETFYFDWAKHLSDSIYRENELNREALDRQEEFNKREVEIKLEADKLERQLRREWHERKRDYANDEDRTFLIILLIGLLLGLANM